MVSNKPRVYASPPTLCIVRRPTRRRKKEDEHDGYCVVGERAADVDVGKFAVDVLPEHFCF